MAQKGRTGIQIISEGQEPVLADVIFVHGLQGDPVETWSTLVPPNPRLGGRLNPFRLRQRSKSQETSYGDSDTEGSNVIFWPDAFLKTDLLHVRIATAGYTSEVLGFFSATGQNNIMQHAQNLVADLQREREDPSRPIIFVCHSIGGIIVKEILRISKGAMFRPKLQSIYTATYGVIFLGTPHRGSPWAPWAKLATNLAKLALGSSTTALIDALRVDSPVLQIIADEFSKMLRSDEIKVYSFREERGMSGLYGFDSKIVDDFSSLIGDAAEGQEGIDANHTEMCKFRSRDDPGYKKVFGVIKSFVEDSQKSISSTTDQSLQEELDRLPTAVQRKIRRDMSYNKLRYSKTEKKAILEIPIFQEHIFRTETKNFPLEVKEFSGSSAFELAYLLQVLPGQTQSHRLETKEITLDHLEYDNDSYYSPCSQDNLLRLVTQHFVSVEESANQLRVQTTIGLFTFTLKSPRWTVQVNFASRTSTSLAPNSQDYNSLKRAAGRQWCQRLGDSISWVSGFAIQRGQQVSWLPGTDMPFDALLLHTNLDHPACIRFLTAADFNELSLRLTFANETCTALLWLYDQHPDAMPFMTKSLHLLNILSKKRILNQDSMDVFVAAAQFALSEAVDPLRREGHNLEDEESTKSVWRFSRLQDELFEVFTPARSRIAVQNHLLAMVVRDASTVAGQIALALLCKGNAELILHHSVLAPQLWLDLLRNEERDIYVG